VVTGLFVGRESELLAIDGWWERGARVVTVTGPAGMGKSRVAQEAARRTERPTAVVDLTAASEQAAFFDAVHRALWLGDEEGASDPAVRLAHALRERGDLLLVLDGPEGVLSSLGGTLASWLARAPELTLLIASQVRLGMAGEVVVELGPLAEAEELFLACGQRTRSGWSPTELDRQMAGEIARELDGVPLAIELAAARLTVVGTRAILHRIRGGAPTGLERAIAISAAGLDEREALSLAQLSIFRGGFTADAAEEVLDTGSESMAVLTALRQKSLVFARDDADGEVRLGLYGMIRDHATRMLEVLPEARARAEARHAEHYLKLAEELGRSPAMRGRLLADRENLLLLVERVARERAVSARAALPALRAVLLLAPVLFAHGALRAYESVVDRVVSATSASGADPRLIAEVLLVRGMLHRHRDAAKNGARSLVQALGIARTLGDGSLEARILLELSFGLEDAGDLPAAEEHAETAAALLEKAGDRQGHGRALARSGALLARRGAVDEGRSALKRAATLHDDAVMRAEDLRSLATLETHAGHLGPARVAIEESLALSSGVDDRRGQALARLQLGLIAQRMGDRAGAREALKSAMDEFGALGFSVLEATAQGHLGVLAREEGRSVDAHARLTAACDALRALAGEGAAALFEKELDADAGGSFASLTMTVVGEGGTWFRPAGGERVELSRRVPLSRIVEQLASERLLRPNAALSSRALQEAAWPKEKMAPSAGAHRVRVAISSLRKLGLPVVTSDDGYALDPSVPMARG